MGTNLDTAKLSYGSRPFILQPPPVSIQATRLVGLAIVGCAIWALLAALYAGIVFGLPHFALMVGISALLAFVGMLTCAFGWVCKAVFDNLQINAFRGKRG